MKKFFTSMAFACVALVGMFVCSCKPENIQTTFKPTAAVATIDVTVIDAETGNDVSSEAQLTFTGEGVHSVGHMATITGNYDIKEMTVKATANYNGKSASTDVHINSLIAGGMAKYAAVIVVGEPPLPPSPVSYTCIKTKHEEEPVVYGYFSPDHAAGHSHDGDIWAYNQTEFLLNVEMHWKAEYGNTECIPSYNMEVCTQEDMTVINSYWNLLNVHNYVEEDVLWRVDISAWAMYTLVGTKNQIKDVYEVIRYEGEDEVVVGKIIVLSVSTEVVCNESAIPGHEGHYIPEHGEKDVHGYSNNAGGGIIWAD